MYKFFDKLRQEKSVSVYAVAKQTGLNNSMFVAWKRGTYSPKVDKLQKIADYFGVTLEYMLTGQGGKDEK